MVFLGVGGGAVRLDLGYEESKRVDTGCLAAWTEGCKCSVKPVGGVVTMVGGKEGLFLTTITGPGTVWLQTMPIQRMAVALVAELPPPPKE